MHLQVRRGEDDRVRVLHLAENVCQAVAKIPTLKHTGKALHLLQETRSKLTVTPK